MPANTYPQNFWNNFFCAYYNQPVRYTCTTRRPGVHYHSSTVCVPVHRVHLLCESPSTAQQRIALHVFQYCSINSPRETGPRVFALVVAVPVSYFPCSAERIGPWTGGWCPAVRLRCRGASMKVSLLAVALLAAASGPYCRVSAEDAFDASDTANADARELKAAASKAAAKSYSYAYSAPSSYSSYSPWSYNGGYYPSASSYASYYSVGGSWYTYYSGSGAGDQNGYSSYYFSYPAGYESPALSVCRRPPSHHHLCHHRAACVVVIKCRAPPPHPE
jgi:hypothetical protein